MLLLQRCALHKFYVTDSQNACDQITGDRNFKRVCSYGVLCIPFIFSGSPNKCWLHTCDTCVITTWRLGLGAPLVARNKQIHVVSKSSSHTLSSVVHTVNTQIDRPFYHSVD